MLNAGNFKEIKKVDMSELCFISVFEVATLIVIKYSSHHCNNVGLSLAYHHGC